jgi:putative ABC transport system substrate-binding protein
VEGQNVAIEYRWARNDAERLPELATDLVRRRAAVIVTPASAAATLAVKAVTATIPIVFQTGGDPVEYGLVASFNKQGGNVTGFVSMNTELGGKRLGLLRELLPKATRFGVLVNPNTPSADSTITEAQRAASAIGQYIDVFVARTNADIDTAFSAMADKRIEALAVNPSPLFSNRRAQLVTLAVRRAVPTIYADREIVEGGGLMSYSSSIADQFRQVGIYAGRILKGENPADLPVMRATKFEFVINLQTAKLLGVDIPPTLLATADEVIE